jgi:hypothetical protein
MALSGMGHRSGLAPLRSMQTRRHFSPCWMALKLLCSRHNFCRTMQLQEAIREIKSCAEQMNARYGREVFDEWAIVSLGGGKAGLVNYLGPRLAGFQKNFASDAEGLREAFVNNEYAVGDFEFARHAVGTGFESFMVVGRGLYLICNNTSASMDMIAKEPTWLGAQKPFVALSDKFRASPLAV